MRAGGFLRYDQDALKQRHPVISVADPPVRFHQLIVRPNLSELELREAPAVWQRCRDTFAAKILGPHVELLAREWTRWYGSEQDLTDVGAVGTTVGMDGVPRGQRGSEC